jgi:hypothetical protein
MPRGPKGEKRPADVIGAAIMVAKIATGEIEDKTSPVPNRERGPYKKALRCSNLYLILRTVYFRSCRAPPL